MFRFYGGQVVKKGTYWNLSNGENIELGHEKFLPGNRQVRYLKAPTIGVFILGPISGLLFICLLPLMSLLIGLTLLSRIAIASDALKSDEAAMCMGCHSAQGIVKTFKNKEKVSVYIEESHFKNTVHGFLSCTNCHSTISMDKHPSAQYASKKEFAIQISNACKTCHSNEQVLARPIHKQAITRANAPPCSDCHGSHSISKVSGWKETASNPQYCLACHKKDLSLSMKGETLSLTINEATLRKSVHSNHNCSDCHVSFSKKSHPIKTFGSKRELSISVSEVCKGCHSEKYKQYQGSIHSNMLAKGNLNAPVCTDCHGAAHSVARAKTDKTLGLKSCNKCHGELNSSYEASIHYMGRIKGNEKAPICSSCHNAHDVQDTSTSTKIKEGCIRCHKNAEKAHNKWLSNPPISLPSFAEAHFDVVSCAACHSPGAKRAIYLSLYDRKTGKPLPEEELLKILDTDSDGLMAKIDTNADGSIDAKEVWDLFAQLYKKGVTTVFMGKMDVRTAVEAHMIGSKAEATKDCEKCHRPDAKLFKDVFIIVKKAEGKSTILNAKREVLNSVFSILPVSKFYALGSTNVKLFDVLFIVALIGGIAVPIGHISFRIITSPLRSLRRMGKGGKK
ncbi:MAG: hypothetical protein WA104_04495 [Thermodesulfovibrionales bacterium]